MQLLLLALGSPAWGWILDRVAIVRCRLLLSQIMTGYLASYFTAIVSGLPAMVYVASILQGISNGGGQLTWALAASHFAPSPEKCRCTRACISCSMGFVV